MVDPDFVDKVKKMFGCTLKPEQIEILKGLWRGEMCLPFVR